MSYFFINVNMSPSGRKIYQKTEYIEVIFQQYQLKCDNLILNFLESSRLFQMRKFKFKFITSLCFVVFVIFFKSISINSSATLNNLLINVYKNQHKRFSNFVCSFCFLSQVFFLRIKDCTYFCVFVFTSKANSIITYQNSFIIISRNVYTNFYIQHTYIPKQQSKRAYLIFFSNANFVFIFY